MNKEYIVWGIPKGDKDETILSTKADTLKEANYLCSYFEDTFKVSKSRVQIIDFSQPLENAFTNVKNFCMQGFPKDGDNYNLIKCDGDK